MEGARRCLSWMAETAKEPGNRKCANGSVKQRSAILDDEWCNSITMSSNLNLEWQFKPRFCDSQVAATAKNEKWKWHTATNRVSIWLDLVKRCVFRHNDDDDARRQLAWCFWANCKWEWVVRCDRYWNSLFVCNCRIQSRNECSGCMNDCGMGARGKELRVGGAVKWKRPCDG